MTDHIDEARKLDPEWRYEIQYGPEGEANYAWIYKGDLFVATMRTHHAVEIVKAIAALAAAEERGRVEERERLVEIVKRRIAVYQTKENASDFLAEPTGNSWDQYRYTREAHEWLLDAIAKEPTP